MIDNAKECPQCGWTVAVDDYNYTLDMCDYCAGGVRKCEEEK